MWMIKSINQVLAVMHILKVKSVKQFLHLFNDWLYI